jgi:hypothetical protein
MEYPERDIPERDMPERDIPEREVPVLDLDLDLPERPVAVRDTIVRVIGSQWVVFPPLGVLKDPLREDLERPVPDLGT